MECWLIEILCYISACCKIGIQRMVYTSTYNVIFGGQVIENGDESLEYLPLDKVHCCPILTRILQMAFQT